MTERRPAGSGTIDQLPSGRFRLRLTLANRERLTRTFATEAEAIAVRDAALQRLADGAAASTGGLTLRSYGDRWLARRETRRVRGIQTERDVWNRHVVGFAHLADWPLDRILTRDVQEWIDELTQRRIEYPFPHPKNGQRLGAKTVRNALTLLKLCFKRACLDGQLSASPVLARMELPAYGHTEERWTYLTFSEQEALLRCHAIPEPDRLIIAFALGTGLRQGEQWALETRDVHAFDEQPHITVRFGSPGMPTKNGRIRRVPLFGLALVTTRRWLQVLPTYASKNPFGLLFPTRMGARRRRGKTFAAPPRPERLRDASAHAVSILSSSAVPMTAMEFGRAAWPTAEWEHRETYLGRRAGTALRRLVARGLVEAVVTFTEGRHGAFVRYATTKAGRALLTGGAPEPKPRSLFRQYLETAGISRRVRWHDLRHSFASSLVAGLWGRPWRLEEVCKVMGHSSITVTERYAHLADDALKGAVLGTPCLDNLQVRERVDRYRRVMLRAVDRAHPPSRIAERACNRFPGDLVPVNGPGTWWWAGRSA